MSTDTYLHVQTKRAGKARGEATSAGHEGDILVRSWSWGVTGNSALGSSNAPGRSYKQLTVDKSVDAASTALLNALVKNDEVKEAKLTMRKAGEGQVDYFTLTLKNARIVSVDLVGDESGSMTEQIALSFTTVEIEYRPQQGTGSSGASHTFSDDL